MGSGVPDRKRAFLKVSAALISDLLLLGSPWTSCLPLMRASAYDSGAGLEHSELGGA